MDLPGLQLGGAGADGPGAVWRRRVLIAVVLVLVVVLVYAVARRLVLGADGFTIEKTRPVVSRVDGLRYRVHEGHAAAQRAADTLATLNVRVIDLMRVLRARYVRGPDGVAHPARREAVLRLLARYNPDNLAENSPADPAGDTSYSLDKGAVVALCLRERTVAARLHDFDTLFFVTLHEMGHIAIDQIDHPVEFWRAFRFLLDEAEEAGIFTSPDFARNPTMYCGVRIDYSPRWDGNTASI